jgi:nicotinamidase-related amidase
MKLEDVEIKNSVLIIVDVQNDFFHEKGGMGSKNISVEPPLPDSK